MENVQAVPLIFLLTCEICFQFTEKSDLQLSGIATINNFEGLWGLSYLWDGCIEPWNLQIRVGGWRPVPLHCDQPWRWVLQGILCEEKCNRIYCKLLK